MKTLAVSLLTFTILLSSCAQYRTVYVPVKLEKIPRPPSPQRLALDASQHICSPENLDVMFTNDANQRWYIKRIESVLDGYERQTEQRDDTD